jgi:dTDP-4-dehydrorhamnose 3,5-epimerase-like enzyme
VTANGPRLIPGGCSVDDRGRVYFANEFDLDPCRRLYFVENFAPGTVRAWHAHRRERKWVTVVRGVALVCCVEIDDWESPSPEVEVHRFVLDASNPAVLSIPAGYANGAMSLAPETKLLYLSDSTLEASLDDDVRYPARLWDPWRVAER